MSLEDNAWEEEEDFSSEPMVPLILKNMHNVMLAGLVFNCFFCFLGQIFNFSLAQILSQRPWVGG